MSILWHIFSRHAAALRPALPPHCDSLQHAGHRDVIAFQKTEKVVGLRTDSPATGSSKSLRELCFEVKVARKKWWLTGLGLALSVVIPRENFAKLMTDQIQKIFTGHVSKTMLLKLFLPSSITSFFGTVVFAAFYFPVPYHWTVHTISSLASPRQNPDFFWLPCVGVVLSALLAWPFAGYVERRLRSIMPRLARAAGLAFALAFVLLLFTGVIVPRAVLPVLGWHRMHEVFARGSAGAFSFGMICCCVCAMVDRSRGQCCLCTALSRYWRYVILLPVICAVIIGALQFLGHEAEQAWAEQIRQSFRYTVMWHLAFWEWIGTLIFYTFMVVTVLLLPEKIKAPVAISTSTKAEEFRVSK
jgi:hypothetical protein